MKGRLARALLKKLVISDAGYFVCLVLLFAVVAGVVVEVSLLFCWLGSDAVVVVGEVGGVVVKGVGSRLAREEAAEACAREMVGSAAVVVGCGGGGSCCWMGALDCCGSLLASCC